MATPVNSTYACPPGGRIVGGRYLSTLAAAITSGVSSTISLAADFPNMNGSAVAISLTSGTLPSGVTLDPIGKRLIYDGTASAPSSFTLTSKPVAPSLTFSNAVGTIPVMAGIAFPKGVVSGSLGASVDTLSVAVRRVWNDGSVKHAVVCGVCDAANTVTFNTSPQGGVLLTSVDITAATPTAVVTLDTLGTVALSSLLSTPSETWISTVNMVECHYRGQVGTSKVWVEFQVRLFSSGAMFIRVCIENNTLKSATKTDYVVNGSVQIFGTSVNTYSSTNLYSNTQHVFERWSNTQYDVVVNHDVKQLVRTKLVPNIGMSSSVSNAALNGLLTTYAPNSNMMYTPSMGNTGYQDQIGLLPMWESAYVLSGDQRAWRSTLAHGKAAFSYPILWRHSGRMLVPTDFPTENAETDGSGNSQTAAGTNIFEGAHHPSMGYLAYLLTGDALYADAMLGVMAVFFQLESIAHGAGVNRLLTGGQTRATAWFKRSLGQTAGILPDGMAELAPLKSWLNSHINFFANISIDDPAAVNSELGYPQTVGTYSETLPLSVASWMHNFWIASMGYISDIEPLTDMTKLVALRNWMYRGVVGLLGDGSGYCYAYASTYNVVVSSEVVPNFTIRKASELYQTWDEVMLATKGVQSCGTALLGDSAGHPTAAAGGYWGNLLPAIAYAVDHNAIGATAAWGRMSAATNWNLVVSSGFDVTPQWGCVPRTPETTSTKAVAITLSQQNTPAYLSSTQIHHWAEVGTNTLSAIDPEKNAAINPNGTTSAPWHGWTGHASVTNSWCGGEWDESRKRLYIWGGGHQDYAGNEMYAWNAITAEFEMLCPPTGSLQRPSANFPYDGLDATAAYSDGRPRSVHTYNNFAIRNNELWMFGGSTFYTGFGPNSVWRWDAIANDFIRDTPDTFPTGAGGAAYDSLRDKFWVFPGGTQQVKIYDPVSKTTSLSAGWANFNATYVKPQYDVLRDCFVCLETDLHIMRSTGNSIKPPVSGTAPTFNKSIAGFVYDTTNDRYLCWHGGNDIYVLTPPAVGQDPGTATWTWSIIAPAAGNVVTPTAPEQWGTYGRFWFSESLNCCGVVNAVNQKMYIFKLG